MGGFFGIASKIDCVNDVFFGTDYHSHLGTRRGGMVAYNREDGFQRGIHSIENSPFRTKFGSDLNEMHGTMGLGCISDTDPQPVLVRSHLGSYALTTVGKSAMLMHWWMISSRTAGISTSRAAASSIRRSWSRRSSISAIPFLTASAMHRRRLKAR